MSSNKGGHSTQTSQLKGERLKSNDNSETVSPKRTKESSSKKQNQMMQGFDIRHSERPEMSNFRSPTMLDVVLSSKTPVNNFINMPPIPRRQTNDTLFTFQSNIQSPQHLNVSHYSDNIPSRMPYNSKGGAFGSVVSLQVFHQVIERLQKQIRQLEDRIEKNQQLVHLSDNLFQLKQQTQDMPIRGLAPDGSVYTYVSNSNSKGNTKHNQTENPMSPKNTNVYTGNSSNNNNANGNLGPGHVNAVSKQNVDLMINNNQKILELGAKLPIFEKQIQALQENNKNYGGDIEQQFNDYTKQINSHIQKFVFATKDLNSKVEVFTDREVRNQTIIEQFEEQINGIHHNMLMTKEEISDTQNQMQFSLNQLEHIVSQISSEIKEFGPNIQLIQDDLVQILCMYKDLSLQIPQVPLIQDDIQNNQENINKIFQLIQLLKSDQYPEEY